MELSDIKEKLLAHQPGLLEQERLYRTAVFVPVIEKGGRLEVLFEVRSLNLKGQPGEICFPGGAMEPGENPETTARRETCEELLVTQNQLEIWGKLDFLLMPFGLIIYPLAGFLKDAANLKPNPAEVAEVFSVPLSRLAATMPEYYEIPLLPSPPEDFPFLKIPHGRNYPWRRGVLPEYFYEVEGRVIWGMTARILRNFLLVVQA